MKLFFFSLFLPLFFLISAHAQEASSALRTDAFGTMKSDAQKIENEILLILKKRFSYPDTGKDIIQNIQTDYQFFPYLKTLRLIQTLLNEIDYPKNLDSVKNLTLSERILSISTKNEKIDIEMDDQKSVAQNFSYAFSDLPFLEPLAQNFFIAQKMTEKLKMKGNDYFNKLAIEREEINKKFADKFYHTIELHQKMQKLFCPQFMGLRKREDIKLSTQRFFPEADPSFIFINNFVDKENSESTKSISLNLTYNNTILSFEEKYREYDKISNFSSVTKNTNKDNQNNEKITTSISYGPDCEILGAEIIKYLPLSHIPYQKENFDREGHRIRRIILNEEAKTLSRLYQENDLYKKQVHVSQKTDRELITIVSTGLDYNHPDLASQIYNPENGLYRYDSDHNERLKTLPNAIQIEDSFSILEKQKQELKNHYEINTQTDEGNRDSKEKENPNKEDDKMPEEILSSLEEKTAKAILSLYNDEIFKLRGQRENLRKVFNPLQDAIRHVGLDLIDFDDFPYDQLIIYSLDQDVDLNKAYSTLTTDLSDLCHYSRGTAIAGLSCQNSPDLAILPLRWDESSLFDFEDLIELVYYKGSRIINLSALAYPKAFTDKMKEAFKKHPDVLFIFSAGNDHLNLDAKDNVSNKTLHEFVLEELEEFTKKESFHNVLVVASVNEDWQLSSFSNYGKETVHLAAFGENIEVLGREQSKKRRSDTAFAASEVARVAAKMKFLNPSLSVSELIEIMMNTSRYSYNLEDKLISSGILDEEAALKKAIEY